MPIQSGLRFIRRDYIFGKIAPRQWFVNTPTHCAMVAGRRESRERCNRRDLNPNMPCTTLLKLRPWGWSAPDQNTSGGPGKVTSASMGVLWSLPDYPRDSWMGSVRALAISFRQPSPGSLEVSENENSDPVEHASTGGRGRLTFPQTTRSWSQSLVGLGGLNHGLMSCFNEKYVTDVPTEIQHNTTGNVALNPGLQRNFGFF